jgi:hypothetical protein
MFDIDIDNHPDDSHDSWTEESDTPKPAAPAEDVTLPWFHPIDGMPPWERWPNESAKAFAAFCAYRDLGPNRSLVSAYRLQKGCERATISGCWSRWRKKYHWKDRAQAFDQERVVQLREAKRQVDLQLMGLRLQRQTKVYSAYAGLADQLLHRVAETLPGLTLVDEVTPQANGGKTVKRGNSPANLARLLQQLRELESCLEHGFPNPTRFGW